jgi:serine/threonine protein kinase
MMKRPRDFLARFLRRPRESQGGRRSSIPQGGQKIPLSDSHPEASYAKGDFIGHKYEVLRLLGSGGCGVVYLTYSRETQSLYALKTFRDEYQSNQEIKERFRKEAMVWVHLERHPFIANASFVEEIAGRLYIAMEYVAPNEQGLNSLEGYLREDPPDLVQALRWAVQFCRGIEYAYSRGIRCHRDIKPSNILIGHDRTVRVSDFGLAGALDVTREAPTMRDATVGFQ